MEVLGELRVGNHRTFVLHGKPKTAMKNNEKQIESKRTNLFTATSELPGGMRQRGPPDMRGPKRRTGPPGRRVGAVSEAVTVSDSSSVLAPSSDALCP